MNTETEKKVEKKPQVVRAYKLPLYHNPKKWEVVRYTAAEYAHFLTMFTSRILFKKLSGLEDKEKVVKSQLRKQAKALGNPIPKFKIDPKFSTEGLGWISNIALSDARGRASALHESALAITTKRLNKLQKKIRYFKRNNSDLSKLELELLKLRALNTGIKLNPPEFVKFNCPGEIQKSKKSKTFSHWVKISGANKTTTYIPTRLTKPVKQKLRTGWKLSTRVDVKSEHVIVYVTKDKPEVRVHDKCLGVDVGYKLSVARSDGYLGFSQKKIIKQSKKSQAERSRQGHKICRGVNRQTQVKQLLDIEAKRISARCQRLKLSLAIETQAKIGNLKIKGTPNWASSHLQNRLYQLSEEHGIKLLEVNPYNTSNTCYSCGYVDKQNRCGLKFECIKCGHKDHADLNASKNIAALGSRQLFNEVNPDKIAKTTCLKSVKNPKGRRTRPTAIREAGSGFGFSA